MGSELPIQHDNGLPGGWGLQGLVSSVPLAGGHTHSVAGADRLWSSNALGFRPIHCLDPFWGLWRTIYSQSVLFFFNQAFQTTYGTGAPDLRPPRLMCSGAAEVCGYEKLGQLAAGGQDQPRRPQLGGGTSEQTTPLLPWEKELEHEHLLEAEWTNIRLQLHWAGSTLLSSLLPCQSLAVG